MMKANKRQTFGIAGRTMTFLNAATGPMSFRTILIRSFITSSSFFLQSNRKKTEIAKGEFSK